jgi:hypothetical protein
MEKNICIQKEQKNFIQKEERNFIQKEQKNFIQNTFLGFTGTYKEEKKEKNIIQTKFGNKNYNSALPLSLPLYYQDGVRCLDFDFNDTNCLSFKEKRTTSSTFQDAYCNMV